MAQLKEYGMDLRVIRGNPTPEEVAALVAALVPRIRAGAPGLRAGAAGARTGAAAEPTRRMSPWQASGLPDTRGPASPRPVSGAWRASARPR
jgi:hypothetical protein